MPHTHFTRSTLLAIATLIGLQIAILAVILLREPLTGDALRSGTDSDCVHDFTLHPKQFLNRDLNCKSQPISISESV